MGAVLIAGLNIVVAVALCISVVRFWSESRYGSESVRRLAALSSAVTLLATAMIYSGEFRYQVLLALQHIGVSHGLYETVKDVVVWLDQTLTDIANVFNSVLGAEEVGYRREPPLWPAALLLTTYSIRFLIYRFHTRSGNREAALTGAAYWCHITTYAMVIAFLIVVSGANPAVLVPASLIALAAIVVSIKLLLEDFGYGLSVALKTLWTVITSVAARVAYIATEVAGVVRDLLAYASKAYVDHIRKPLRRGLEALELRNERAREVSKRRLARQNARHAERFGGKESGREKPPPSV